MKCEGGILSCKLNVAFFFNDTATTEIYTLSLHDALPISISHFMVLGQKISSWHIMIGMDDVKIYTILSYSGGCDTR